MYHLLAAFSLISIGSTLVSAHRDLLSRQNNEVVSSRLQPTDNNLTVAHIRHPLFGDREVAYSLTPQGTIVMYVLKPPKSVYFHLNLLQPILVSTLLAYADPDIPLQ